MVGDGVVTLTLDCYELKFTSEPSQVRDIVRSLLDFVDGQMPSTEVRSDLKLIFSELLYNAVVHGNKGDCNKSVQVKVKKKDGRLMVDIRDEGDGFDYRRVTNSVQTDEKLFEERGRGMALVLALTENLSFNEIGNHIRFEKRLK